MMIYLSKMRYELASDTQLKTIINHDKDCSPALLGGVALEMIKRKLWDGIILFAGKRAFPNFEHVLQSTLKIDYDELIHLGHIEIVKIIDTFKPGMRTFKTYAIMCLESRFKKLKRAAEQEMRRANIDTFDVDKLESKMQDRIFQSPVNVERYVINKITVEENWGVLREVEKKAIILEQYGYKQYEIADLLGFNTQTHANVLLKRAYAKLKKSMGA